MTRPRSNTPRPALDVQRLVDLMVFAPIGLGTVIVTEGPDAVRRVKQELRNARFVGRLAVDRSVVELRRRIEDATAPTDTSDVIDVETVEVAPVSDDRPVADAPASDTLALPDYDTLPAIDIVDKLEHLTDEERSEIGRYEESNRRRRTVLGKLDQLAGS